MGIHASNPNNLIKPVMESNRTQSILAINVLLKSKPLETISPVRGFAAPMHNRSGGRVLDAGVFRRDTKGNA